MRAWADAIAGASDTKIGDRASGVWRAIAEGIAKGDVGVIEKRFVAR